MQDQLAQDHTEIVHRYVTVSDGLRLHATDRGPRETDALPVVCLPGLARTSADFDCLGAALARGDAGRPRRVVALDYRGRGQSEWDKDWRNYDLAIENADILTMLDALGVGEAIFVGTSRGGIHAMIMTATRPAALRAVVLNDIGPVLERQGLIRIRGYVGKLPQPASWADAADLARHVMSAHFTALSEEEWDAYARLTFVEENGKFAANYDPGLMRALNYLDLDKPLPDMWAQFAGFGARPVLALRGENSDLLSPETLEEMTRRLPHCTAFVVPGQGHAPLLLDAPTIARICAFVAEVDREENPAR